MEAPWFLAACELMAAEQSSRGGKLAKPESGRSPERGAARETRRGGRAGEEKEWGGNLSLYISRFGFPTHVGDAKSKGKTCELSL